jgi:hypothetical protein
MLPFFAPGAQGAIGLQLGRLRVEVLGLWLPPELEASAQTPRVGSRIGLLAGTLHLGYEWRFSSLALGPYAGASLASLFGEARGVDATPQRNSATLGTVEAGAAASWYFLPWLGLRMEAGLGRPFSRPRFVVQGLGVVHQPSPLTGQISLGIFFHIQ